jgi:putative phosphoesterase
LKPLAPTPDPVFDAPMLIGVISDTHGLLRPEALHVLAGVEHIIHAGDIGSPDIVPSLAEIAPVTAIRGNVDTQAWAKAFAPGGSHTRRPDDPRHPRSCGPR